MRPSLFSFAVLAGSLALIATPAAAQVWPAPGLGATAMDRHRYDMDRHRQALELQRLRTDQAELEARQSALQAQAAQLRLDQARAASEARAADVTYDASTGMRRLRSPEEERSLRESATRRRETVQAGTAQINDWLDRAR